MTTLQSRVLTCTSLLWQILGVVKIKPVVCEGVTSPAGSDNISSLRITRSKIRAAYTERQVVFTKCHRRFYFTRIYSTLFAWTIEAVATSGTFEWNRSATCNSNFQSIETGFEAYFSHYASINFVCLGLVRVEIIAWIVTKEYYFFFCFYWKEIV